MIKQLQFVQLIILFSFLFFVPNGITNTESISQKSKFSMEFKNETLRDVVHKLSRTYDYRIELHTKIPDETLSSKFKNLELQKAISWVFRDYNHFEIWDDHERVIKLFIFKGNTPTTDITDKLKMEQTTKTIIN